MIVPNRVAIKIIPSCLRIMSVLLSWTFETVQPIQNDDMRNVKSLPINENTKMVAIIHTRYCCWLLNSFDNMGIL